MNINEIHKNGFVIYKNFFSDDEVNELKEFAKEYKNNLDHQGCPSLLKHSEYFFCNEKIFNLLKDIFKTNPIYFGDSNFLTGSQSQSGNMTFHKDSVDRLNFSLSDWQSPYTVIRVAIFFLDHSKYSGAISFRKKSHMGDRFKRTKLIKSPLIFLIDFIELIFGISVYASTKPNDLVIWKLTTDHAANSNALKFSINKAITKFTNWIPSFLKLPKFKGERLGFVATFGIRDHHLERYIRYLKTRNYMLDHWKNSNYQNKTKVGLYDLEDVGKEVSSKFDYFKSKAHDNWKPIDN